MGNFGIFEQGGKYFVYKLQDPANPDSGPVGEAVGGPFDTPELAQAKIDELGAAAATPGATQAAAGATASQPPAPKRVKSNVSHADEITALKAQVDSLTRQVGAAAQKSGGFATVKAAQESPFDSMGEQLQAVRTFAVKGEGLETVLNKFKAIKAMPGAKAILGNNETIDSEGAVLLQPDYAKQLFMRAYETNDILQKVMTQEVGPNSNSYGVPMIDESSRATGSRYGGIRVYRAAEGYTVESSKPNFKRKVLMLEKLMAICYATDESLQDARMLESEINRLFPLEFNFVILNELLRGNGAGQMLGIFNSPAYIAVAATSNDPDTVLASNISAMYARMWAPSRKNAVWLINQALEPQLDTLSIPAGVSAFQPHFVKWDEEGVMRLKGRPVIPIEQASAPGDLGDISLIDFSQYLMITKGGLQADMSIHVQFLTAQSTFRFIVRNNGMPLWDSALTPFQGADTLSPFVGLAAR